MITNHVLITNKYLNTKKKVHLYLLLVFFVGIVDLCLSNLNFIIFRKKKKFLWCFCRWKSKIILLWVLLFLLVFFVNIWREINLIKYPFYSQVRLVNWLRGVSSNLRLEMSLNIVQMRFDKNLFWILQIEMRKTKQKFNLFIYFFY